jgi:hypothetical protein
MSTKLGLTEFRQVFLENIDSITITSLSHIDSNESFYEDIIFKLFDLYQRESSDYSVNEILKFVHIFLFSAFKYKLDVYKDDDEIKLY